jgi:cold shock CspA family protein
MDGHARSWSRFGLCFDGAISPGAFAVPVRTGCAPGTFPNSASEAIMRETGKIKRYYKSPRGFGFIRRAGCADLFFHYTDVQADQDAIRDGALVEFELRLDKTGRPAAAGVTLLRNW